VGNRVEFLRNYCLDNLFVKTFCTWKSAHIVRKNVTMFSVFCLLFIRYFEGCLEFFAASQY